MSRENVELVRSAITYFGETGDLAEERYDAEVVFVTRSDGPGQGVFHGIDGLRNAVRSFAEVWETSAFEAKEFVEVGNVVVVPFLFHLRAQSGVELDVEETWAYWVRGGKIHRIEQHPTKL